MPRIFLPASDIKDNRISITDEKAHYITSVLRCKKGDELTIFDGKGDCFRTTILRIDRREIITEVIERFPWNTESSINIVLVQGLLKGQKMDMVVQKTTELGVKGIMPVITKRSQLRETRKIARWRKIAEEASRQSGRNVVPTVHDATRFSDVLNTLSPNAVNGLIFYEEGGMKLSEAVEIFKQRFNYTLPTRDGIHTPAPLSRGDIPLHPSQEGIISSPPAGEGKGEGELLIIIGPEGGFTKKEVTLAEGKGLLVTSLGRRILRAETSAISSVTLVQFLLGDMG
ncbi:MAG: hypothetical protein A2Y66_03035 [Nitrospirae bacterium RBG_13_41_22]|nr:MAG: hypothetical protein A2Y66_03035 [Nitrospirae bacterium RBG_13_41_22]OHE59164.1 MAG: hypothetical protein A2Z47_06450 [Thermodesulfovibrio sp. RBG_19FT_COMBO_42_12]